MRLVALVAAWILGLLIGLELDVPISALAFFSLAALILAYLFRHRGFSPLPALLVLVVLMGLLRVEVSEGQPLMASDNPKPVMVRGLIVDDPEISGRGVVLTVSVEEIDRGTGREEADGKVLVLAQPPGELVRTRDEPYFRYGDRLEFTGRLEEPPVLGDFDYGAYLAAQGIHSRMSFPEVSFVDGGGGNPARGFLYDLRRRVSRGIDRALPEPQASLAQALLLGLRGPLPEDVTQEFRSTGTSHLLAISGLHVGVLLTLSLAAGAWLMGRRRQLYLLLPLGTIWLYALLSGLSPSVERAAIMGSVYLLALALGRPRSALPALALAAGVMASLDPQLLKQVSFQLSFTAVAGIALVSNSEWQLWTRFVSIPAGGSRWRSILWKSLVLAAAVSVAATVATLPLVAFNFQRIPTVGIPATVLTLPAIPFLLLGSAVAAVAGMASTPAGQVVGWLAWVPLEYVLQLVHLFSRVPESTFSVPAFSGTLVWAYYGILALLLLSPGGPRALWHRLRRTIASGHEKVVRESGPAITLRFSVGLYVAAAVGLCFLATVLWLHFARGPDGRLHVYFLDVGQGDSTLIVTPEGTQVLVDGGPRAMDAVRALGGRLPFWDRALEMVVLTHPDEDHFRGLVEVVDRYGVGLVLENGGSSENPLFLEWRRRLQERDLKAVSAFSGQTIALGEATTLEVLNPPLTPLRGTGSDRNNNAVVLRLAYGGVSFLLTADVEAVAEGRLLQGGAPLRSTVLRVAHHGSRTSTTTEFLTAVNPVAAVISAGADNPHGHPHPEVTDRLELASAPGRDGTYLTAERGDVEFIPDGRRLWVKTER